MTKQFHYYEHKDSIIGTIGNIIPPNKYSNPQGIRAMDFLIIRKENKLLFVEVYDEINGEYFKNEYSFSELINHLKELDLREKEAQNRYYAQIANKTELEITHEITEMLDIRVFSRIKGWTDESLFFNFGIKNRAQLENLHFGKPTPKYKIINRNLTFIGEWQVSVNSDEDPLLSICVKVEGGGQYHVVGYSAATPEAILNYEYKNLIIGFLGGRSLRGLDYLIIRKDNTDIFVEVYDYATGEYFKNEYSLDEIINFYKK